jgi:hypothetical protein
MTYLEHLLLLVSIMVVSWSVFTYLWPRLLLLVYKRAILNNGFGEGPIPVNTLYTESQSVFADPLHKLTSAPRVATSGVNRDTLMIMGWLDLSQGPLILHVPDMASRYYSVQFTNPSDNTNFAYVGKRTTGTQAGDYLITRPGWKGLVPGGIKQISSPNKSVLVVGRVFVENESDLSTAYAFSKQIELKPYHG